MAAEARRKMSEFRVRWACERRECISTICVGARGWAPNMPEPSVRRLRKISWARETSAVEAK